MRIELRPEAVRAIAIAVTVACATAVSLLFGLGPALIVLAAGALLIGIALLWASVQNLTGETPISFEEALTLGAPTAEEEQKRAILRALKDLEYELSVGKITPEDHQELSARYRADARRLMQSLDEHLGPAREQAEKMLRERLAKAGIDGSEPATPEAETKAAAAEQPEPAAAEDEDDAEPSSEPAPDRAEVKS